VLESTPKEVLQNFLGVSYLLLGVKPSDPPSNTALDDRRRSFDVISNFQDGGRQPYWI